ncbi:uncharacterized protein LOC142002894 [Carettochelys insculpta]|uniref:uncharacterized protein LOC142002894 n=1 Tax=Carettochelys insculpta TaxID=44489 RepID=UPI003EB9DB51
MAGRTVRVEGIPTDLPPERVVDKLTIHFLRSRNGGGEIADIHITTGSPACALVTFEDAEVAQRVLAVEKHVLSVHGRAYPLTVTAHAAELSPDEIFVRVCMIIDYRRLVDGKTLLRSLRQRYSNVQFSFDAKEPLCTVKGPYTELQAFSQALLRSQQAGEAPPGEVSPRPTVTGTSAAQQGPRSPLPEPTVEKQPRPGQVHKEASEPPLPRAPVDGEAVEKLEDFSLVMDADIYLYLQKFCSSEYRRVLQQHQVDVVDISSDGIAILYLQASSKHAGNIGAVLQARLALLQLYQQLEASLRKEKVSKAELAGDVRGMEGELQKLYPLLLCHEDESHLYLIGNLVDVSQAKQYLQDQSAERRVAANFQMLSASLPTYTAALPGGEARPGKPESSLAASSRLSTLELKGEHRLAANFSFPKHDGSPPGTRPPLDCSSLLPGQAEFSGSCLKAAGGLGQSNPAPLSGQHPLPVSAAITGPAAEVQQKDWDHRKGDPRLARPKTLSLFAAGKDNSAGQSLGSWKSSGPVKPPPVSEVSAAFRSLSLFDTTGTCSALDGRELAPSAPLRRSNSFSIPAPKASDAPRGRAAGGGQAATEEMRMDPVQWAYLKDVHSAAIGRLCREGGVLLSERRGRDCTVLTFTAEDRTKLLQARWKMESLCQTVCPRLICQSFSYFELDVDGPSDEALNELCSLLRGCSDQVRVSKDRYKLHLLCPKETLARVNEEFRRFSARRRSASQFSSPSPGPEGSLCEAHPSPPHQAKAQDPALAAEHRQSQEGLQQLEGSATAGLPEGTPQLDGADTRRLGGPGWSAMKTSSYQQTVGQEEPSYRSDSQDVQSCDLDASLADKQSRSPGDPQEVRKGERADAELEAARTKRVLPDRFQLARDRSRGGSGEAGGGPKPPAPAADGAPLSLPLWLSSSGTGLLARAATEQPPKPGQGDPASQEGPLIPAGDRDMLEVGVSELERRSPSPGQEAHEQKLGKCDACQSLHMLTCHAPCGHALCRACFAAEDPHPACCSAPKATRAIKGTFKVVTMAQSLPGYYRDPTLQIIYDIPDGVQEAGDPRPGRPYRGGRFNAFLPDNREGKKISQLLQKAFKQGLTFQLQSCNGEEQVTWHLIPHKTSFDKGKARKGYPDSQYLREVCAVLRNLGIE